VDVTRRVLGLDLDDVFEVGTVIANGVDRFPDGGVDHDRFRPGVGQPVLEGVLAEEHGEGDRHRAELPVGEVGERILGFLGDDDADAVAHVDSEVRESLCEPAGLAVEVAEGVGLAATVGVGLFECDATGVVVLAEEVHRWVERPGQVPREVAPGGLVGVVVRHHRPRAVVVGHGRQ